MEMTHDTLLTDKDAMQEKLKSIMEDFAKLPPERQQKIVEAVIKQMGDIVLTKIQEAGAELQESIPVLLELMQQKVKDKDDDTPGGG